MTGLKCPGCGSQRAIHYILNFDVLNALKENIILVAFIPYLLVSVTVDLINKLIGKLSKLRKLLLGKKAICIIFSIIISFWILRNIIK
ncbi:MAG: DUF2752 domain-containing protein [Prevotellaceae bacterium]|nr:DUF2752 domain-containing protein [Prevotellaceae bacterium]